MLQCAHVQQLQQDGKYDLALQEVCQLLGLQGCTSSWMNRTSGWKQAGTLHGHPARGGSVDAESLSSEDGGGWLPALHSKGVANTANSSPRLAGAADEVSRHLALLGTECCNRVLDRLLGNHEWHAAMPYCALAEQLCDCNSLCCGLWDENSTWAAARYDWLWHAAEALRLAGRSNLNKGRQREFFEASRLCLNQCIQVSQKWPLCSRKLETLHICLAEAHWRLGDREASRKCCQTALAVLCNGCRSESPQHVYAIVFVLWVYQNIALEEQQHNEVHAALRCAEEISRRYESSVDRPGSKSRAYRRLLRRMERLSYSASKRRKLPQCNANLPFNLEKMLPEGCVETTSSHYVAEEKQVSDTNSSTLEWQTMPKEASEVSVQGFPARPESGDSKSGEANADADQKMGLEAVSPFAPSLDSKLESLSIDEGRPADWADVWEKLQDTAVAVSKVGALHVAKPGKTESAAATHVNDQEDDIINDFLISTSQASCRREWDSKVVNDSLVDPNGVGPAARSQAATQTEPIAGASRSSCAAHGETAQNGLSSMSHGGLHEAIKRNPPPLHATLAPSCGCGTSACASGCGNGAASPEPSESIVTGYDNEFDGASETQVDCWIDDDHATLQIAFHIEPLQAPLISCSGIDPLMVVADDSNQQEVTEELHMVQHTPRAGEDRPEISALDVDVSTSSLEKGAIVTDGGPDQPLAGGDPRQCCLEVLVQGGSECCKPPQAPAECRRPSQPPVSARSHRQLVVASQSPGMLFKGQQVIGLKKPSLQMSSSTRRPSQRRRVSAPCSTMGTVGILSPFSSGHVQGSLVWAFRGVQEQLQPPHLRRGKFKT